MFAFFWYWLTISNKRLYVQMNSFFCHFDGLFDSFSFS